MDADIQRNYNEIINKYSAQKHLTNKQERRLKDALLYEKLLYETTAHPEDFEL